MAYKQNKSPLHQSAYISGMLGNAVAGAAQPQSVAAGLVANNTPAAPTNQNFFDPIISGNTPPVQSFFDPIISGNTPPASTTSINTAGTPLSGFNSMAQTQVNNAMANAVKTQPKIVNNQSQTVKPQPVQPTVQAVQAPMTKPNEVAPSPINPSLFSNMETIGKLNENTTFWGDRYKESF
jgi:outer membrane biosynthesis protein TonB